MIPEVSKPELLAPVCNTEALYGVIRAGADAVYLGGSRFGARAYAENLSDTELLRAIDYVRLHGKKLYLTVNTLIKEKETDKVLEFLRPLAENGLHGVIVQDMGILRLFRSEFPEVSIHASTQMAVTDPSAARLLLSRGVKRAVPARELSLEELSAIRDTGIEVEAFIHGAMCYSYSGLCLFSSMLGDRSGNRGRCAQACRLPYRYRQQDVRYPLSMRDMCAAGQVRKLIQAGVTSFKIEGRMKAPEYCAGVTEIYRRLIDHISEDRGENEEEKYINEAVERLSGIYLRSEVCGGFFDRRNDGSMITLDSPSYSGSDPEVITDIRERLLSGPEKTGVNLSLRVRAYEPARLRVTGRSASGNTLTVSCDSSQNAEIAKKREMTAEDFEKHLCKLGDSFLTVESFEADLGDEGVFLPVSVINELRRECVRRFMDKVKGDKIA